MKSGDPIINMLLDFEEHIEGMFNELIYDRWGRKKQEAWKPHTDVVETESEVVVMLDLPGVDPGEVEVRKKENVLVIYGSRFEQPVSSRYHHVCERLSGPFERIIELDEDMEYEDIRTDYNNGVFTVTLKKKVPRENE